MILERLNFILYKGGKMANDPQIGPLAHQNGADQVDIFNLPVRFGPAHLTRQICGSKVV